MARLSVLHLLLALIAAAAILLSPPGAHDFYLLGSYLYKYSPSETLNEKVNSVTSIDTRIPCSYYSLPFCMPPEGVKGRAENLGGLLMGDRIENSPYRLKMYTTSLTSSSAALTPSPSSRSSSMRPTTMIGLGFSTVATSSSKHSARYHLAVPQAALSSQLDATS